MSTGTHAVIQLAQEILRPGSKANVNERDAAQLAVTWRGNPRLMGQDAVEQLKAYYQREHLGQMSTHLTPLGV